MIWYILSVLVLGFSLIAAVYRYFQLTATTLKPPKLSFFVIQNTANLTSTTLSSIYQKLQTSEPCLSFEVLLKGFDKVLVIVCPHWLAQHFPELKLLEIEDYTTPLDATNITTLEYRFKSSEARIMTDFANLLEKNTNLLQNESLFYQISTKSYSDSNISINFRVLIKSPDRNRQESIKQSFSTFLSDYACLIPVVKPIENVQFFRSRQYLEQSDAGAKISLTDLDRLLI